MTVIAPIARAADTAIAIITGAVPAYNTQCLKRSLEALYCRVDLLSLATAPTNAKTATSATKTLGTAEQLKPYHLVIYCYSQTRHKEDFTPVSRWLEHYNRALQGRVMVRYCAAPPLHNYRAFHHAAQKVRQLEQERQAFSEWVQDNAQRFFWAGDSSAATHELSQWGVVRHRDSLGVSAPFMALSNGAYAEQASQAHPDPTLANKHDRPTVLVVGDYRPDTGHAALLTLLAHYLQCMPAPIKFHFYGASDSLLGVYREDIDELVERLELGEYVQFSALNDSADSEGFLHICLGAQLMLGLQQAGRYQPWRVQAQAMGLVSLELTTSFRLPEAALLIQQNLYDEELRQRTVLANYRHIGSHYNHSNIEQVFLSQVLSALQR